MIYSIRLLTWRRWYELLVPRGDYSDVMAHQYSSRHHAFLAARDYMDPGDVLFYCADLPCHEMYWCRGSSTHKRLIPSTSSRFDITCFEQEYREYLSQAVLSLDEATQLYGRCWDVYGDLGPWRNVETTTAESTDWLVQGMMFGINFPEVRDSNVSLIRNLYRCNYQPHDRYCVLTSDGFRLVRPTWICESLMRVNDDTYAPVRFNVYGRAIDIYCSVLISQQDKLQTFCNSLQAYCECMRFLGFDCTPMGSTQRAALSPAVPCVVRPDMTTRMVTL